MNGELVAKCTQSKEEKKVLETVKSQICYRDMQKQES